MRSLGVLPGVESHNALIHGLSQAGQMAQAVKGITRMRTEKLKPDVVTCARGAPFGWLERYTSIIGGFASQNRMKMAEAGPRSAVEAWCRGVAREHAADVR